jgi:hypothetical protein
MSRQGGGVCHYRPLSFVGVAPRKDKTPDFSLSAREILAGALEHVDPLANPAEHVRGEQSADRASDDQCPAREQLCALPSWWLSKWARNSTLLLETRP